MSIETTEPSRSLRINATRIALFAYFLTFGFFGYGSGIHLDSPTTWVPALAGLLATLSLSFSKFDLNIFLSLKVKALRGMQIQYLVILAVLSLILWPSIPGELANDELAYVRLASTHAREFVGRFDVFDSSMSSSTAVQIVSVLVLVFVLAPVGAVIYLAPLKRAIIFASLTSFVFQLGYSVFGSWGWGYPEISWFPYLFTSSIFGLSPVVFTMTSVSLVALGLLGLFRGLERFDIGQALRILIVGVVATLPIPTLFFSSVDHVIYFAIFGLPGLLIMVSKPDYQRLRFGVLLLSVGVLFRITLVVPLLVMIVLFLISCREQKRSLWVELRSHPGLILLIPYGAGFLLFPTVFSGGVASALVQNGSSGRASFLGSLGGGLEQLGIILAFLVLVGLFASLLSIKNFAIGIVFLLSFLYLYFYVLAGAELGGELKYSAECLVILVAWSLLTITVLITRIRGRKRNLLMRVLFVGFLALVLSTNVLTILNQNSLVRIEGSLLRGQQPSPAIGYMEAQNFLMAGETEMCTPVGVVYGASNELLAGRDISVYRNAEATFFEVQSAEITSGGSWTSVSASTLNETQIVCLYGSKDAFRGLSEEMWSDWTLVFPLESQLDSFSVRVLTRDR